MLSNVVSGYAPQVGCELEEKVKFWSEVDEVMRSIRRNETVAIGTDFNGHVGDDSRGDEEMSWSEYFFQKKQERRVT